MPYQYGNQANPDAHYYGTAEEIIEELDEVTAFVAGLGTGGTLMGNGRRLKEHDPSTKIVAAEPLQGEDVQGLRSLDDGFIPPIIDISLLDRKILVSNRDGIVWTQKLFFEEGIFAGVSSGAIASVAVRMANELDEGNVVFVVADDGSSTCRPSSGRSRSTSSRPSTPPSGGRPRAHLPRSIVRRDRRARARGAAERVLRDRRDQGRRGGEGLPRRPMPRRARVRYELDPREQYRITMEIEEQGWELGRDLPLAHPERRLSLADGHQPRLLAGRALPDRLACGPRAARLRAFRIVDGEIEEVELAIA